VKKSTPIVRALALAAGLACAAAAPVQAQFSTNITYQGQLKEGAALANGTYEMVFALYDAQTGGTAVDRYGAPSAPINVGVQNGIFTQELQFAQPAAFTGQDRWLEIQLRPQGTTPWTVLASRQKITAAPYALQTRGIQVTSNSTGVMARIGPTAAASQYTAVEFNSGAAPAWTIAKDPGNNLLFVQGTATNGPKAMTIAANGNIGIGLGAGLATAPLQVFGRAKVNILEITGGSDIAEPFDVSGQVEPGMIVCIDRTRLGAMRVADQAYDSTVAGVISGAGGVNTGMVLRQEGSSPIADGQHPVALSGRVWCRVDADAGGAVRAGDFITTSATPGHGMRATDDVRRPGAVIGKAMSDLESGRGLVLVLVNLQ
jgi:hypothetical protein